MIESKWLQAMKQPDSDFWLMHRENPTLQTYVLIKNLTCEPGQKLDLDKVKRRYRVWIQSVKSELLTGTSDKDDSFEALKKKEEAQSGNQSQEEGELPQDAKKRQGSHESVAADFSESRPHLNDVFARFF